MNPVTNEIYVANYTSNNVTVINGVTNTVVATVTDPNANGPTAVAVNPVTNQIYVANYNSNNVTVIDGTTSTVIASVDVGTTPIAVAVNPATTMIYVANYGSNNVSVIAGATNTIVAAVTDPSAQGPTAVGANPVTNTIYVANYGVNSDFSSAVTVINGADNSVTSLSDAYASEPYAVAVNPVTNKIYVPDYNSAQVSEGVYENFVEVIDGATNTITDVFIPTPNADPVAVAVNPVTNMIYVADYGGGDGTTEVITEQQVQAIPILTTITPLAGNQTDSLTTNFSFTATNSMTTAPIDNLLFQVDTWQAPWLVGSPQGGGKFNGASPSLQPGFHILYAYSTDGEEATSTNTGGQSSPLIGNIAAYGFLVAAPEAGLSPNPVPFGQPGVRHGQHGANRYLDQQRHRPPGLRYPAIGGTNPNDFQISSDNCVSPLAGLLGTCTIDYNVHTFAHEQRERHPDGHG